MRTQAAVLRKTGKQLKIEQLTCPELKNGQVLVEIKFSGICHSQLNEIFGLKGKDRFLPHTLGHEGSGIVKKVSNGVKKVKPGDHVVLTWIKGSGADVASCVYSRDGNGIVNSGAIATLLTYAVISENRLVKIPHNMPLDKAALLGCAIPTGAGIVLNTIKPGKDSVIVVFGAGGIGISAIIAAAYKKCRKVIAVDINEKKLKLARKFGATDIINAAKENPVPVIMSLTGGYGADFAIEAAGVKRSMEDAFMSIKNKAGLLVIAGNLPKMEKICIDPFELIKGKRVLGSWGGQTDPDLDIPKYAKLYLAGKFPLDNLISHIYPIDEVNSAFSDLKAGKVSRAVIKLNEGCCRENSR